MPWRLIGASRQEHRWCRYIQDLFSEGLGWPKILIEIWYHTSKGTDLAIYHKLLGVIGDNEKDNRNNNSRRSAYGK